MIKMENDVLLKVNNLSKSFMGLKAVDSLSLEVPKNSVIGLIGPNGAGKSTVFNLITKLYDYDNGDIYFEHHCINNLKSHQVAKLGVARTFQNIRLYNNLSVLENVIVALDTDFDYNMLHVLTNSKKYKDIEEWKINKACELLKMTEGLYEMRFQKAHSLSYGAQRKLEIIRAMALNPKLLLMDEPAAGMNATEKQELKEYILKVVSEGISVLLIEHDMSFVMNICSKIVVLNFGKKIAEGVPREIQSNKDVMEAYLGRKEDAEG